MSDRSLPKNPQRRHGYQPIQDIIESDGRTIRGFVRLLKSNQAHALLAIAGRTAPSQELRDELVAKLDIPLAMIFTQSAIEAEYSNRGRRGSRTLMVGQ